MPSGSEAAASRTARSAVATEATSPLNATPRATRCTCTPSNPASPAMSERSGPRSSPTSRLFSTSMPSGIEATARPTARSAAARELTSPPRATPRANRCTCTPCRSGSAPSNVRKGSTSITTNTSRFRTDPFSLSTEIEVLPALLPMTYSTVGERSCTSAISGEAAATDFAGLSRCHRRLFPNGTIHPSGEITLSRGYSDGGTIRSGCPSADASKSGRDAAAGTARSVQAC